MRGASLRALLLALAMVIQTIAGVSGVAHASPVGGGESAYVHCDPASATGDAPAPASDSQGHAACQHCLLCVAGVDVATSTQVVVVAFFRHPAQAGFLPSSESPPANVSREASRARGPPAARV